MCRGRGRLESLLIVNGIPFLRGLRLATATAVIGALAAATLGVAAPPLAPGPNSVQTDDQKIPNVDFSVLSPKQMVAALNVLYGVDFDGLSPEQIKAAVRVLYEEKCLCGLPVARCLVTDEHSAYSRPLASEFLAELRRGTTVEQARIAIVKAIETCAGSQQPAGPLPILESTSVEIPIAGAPSRGPKDARVTIVAFSDFQCPGCAQASHWADSIITAFPKDVRIVFKQFPLDFHEQAREAAEASLAANEQGKFWPMHDKMFAHNESLNREAIRKSAEEIGLDVKALDQSLDSGRYRERVDEDIADGMKIGVNGTPLFFINGRRYNGMRTMEAIRPIIESEIKGASSASK